MKRKDAYNMITLCLYSCLLMVPTINGLRTIRRP